MALLLTFTTSKALRESLGIEPSGADPLQAVDFQKLMSSEAAKMCIKNDLFGEFLLQQHYLPRKDEIACPPA